MASYRQRVPLREAETIDVQDGTMCRMPSPQPGPLQGKIDVTTNEEQRNELRPLTESLEEVAKTASALAIGSAA